MKFAKHKYLAAAIAILLCLFCFAACSNQPEDPGNYYEPPAGNDPPIQVDPPSSGGEDDPPAVNTSGNQEFKTYAAGLLDSLSASPVPDIDEILRANPNLHIEDLNMFMFSNDESESMHIPHIYVTGNMAHAMFDVDQYGSPVEAGGPTDTYLYWNKAGSYQLAYDGYHYTHTLQPAEEFDFGSSGSELEAEDLLYNPYENTYTVDPEAAHRWYATILESLQLDGYLGDELIQNSYVMISLQEDDEPGEIGKLEIKATNIADDLQRDYLRIVYDIDIYGNKTIDLFFDAGAMDIDVKIMIAQESDTRYSVDIEGFMSAPLVMGNIQLSVSFAIETATEDYFVPSGFVREYMQTAERVLNNLGTIEARYASSFTADIEDGYEACEEIYVYDQDLECYIVFGLDDDGYYWYDRVELECDYDTCCTGEHDDTYFYSINVTGHTAPEMRKHAIESKYAGEYTASSDCDVVAIYDEEYRIYVYFARVLGTRSYVYMTYSNYLDGSLACFGVMNPLIDEIGVQSHSTFEETTSALEGIEFDVVNREVASSEIISVYDDDINMYLVFVLKDLKAYYVAASADVAGEQIIAGIDLYWNSIVLYGTVE